MEHAIHLAAGHFISKIAPSAVPKLLSGPKGATPDWGKDHDDGDTDDDTIGDDLADTIGKALALVKQVRHLSFFIPLLITLQIRKSPQARVFFKQCCREAQLPSLELVQWVRTRWASMHAFLNRALVLQKVFPTNITGKF